MKNKLIFPEFQHLPGDILKYSKLGVFPISEFTCSLWATATIIVSLDKQCVWNGPVLGFIYLFFYLTYLEINVFLFPHYTKYELSYAVINLKQTNLQNTDSPVILLSACDTIPGDMEWAIRSALICCDCQFQNVENKLK